MMFGAALLTSNDAVSKFLAETYPIGQVVALRQSCSLLVILPYIHWVAGWDSLRIVNLGGQAARATFFVATTVCIVWGLSLLPLTTVIAIAFSSPVFVVALSGPLLGEKVGIRRWGAVMVGFIGMLMIVRPGGASFTWLLLIPVFAAMCAASRDMVTRRISRTESSVAILFWSAVVVVVLTLMTSFFGWKPVTPQAAAWLLLNGALAAGAHFFMIEALRLGDASLVSPFRYTGLIWAAFLGYMIWGHLPDSWTWAGAGLLIASGIYIAEREARLGGVK